MVYADKMFGKVGIEKLPDSNPIRQRRNSSNIALSREVAGISKEPTTIIAADRTAQGRSAGGGNHLGDIATYPLDVLFAVRKACLDDLDRADKAKAENRRRIVRHDIEHPANK